MSHVVSWPSLPSGAFAPLLWSERRVAQQEDVSFEVLSLLAVGGLFH